MDKALLDILACPNCKGSLIYRKSDNELICPTCRVAYPIRDGIPVMLTDETRALADNEKL